MESTPVLAGSPEPKAAENIHRILKREILTGEIEPGALLSESKLAKRFGVSRTPVREALSMLANERLIFSLPQRGHQVRTVSFSDVVDAFHTRELLEVEGVRLAVQHISDEKIVYLRAMTENTLYNNLSEQEQMVFNYEFHSTIARGSGNHILAEFIEELLVFMQRVLVVNPEFDRLMNEGISPEAEIVTALEKRDEQAACEAMRRHIRNTMNRVLKIA